MPSPLIYGPKRNVRRLSYFIYQIEISLISLAPRATPGIPLVYNKTFNLKIVRMIFDIFFDTYSVSRIVGQSLSEAVHVGVHVANNSDWPAMFGGSNGSHARQGYRGFEFASKRSTHPSDLEFNTHMNKPWINTVDDKPSGLAA